MNKSFLLAITLFPASVAAQNIQPDTTEIQSLNEVVIEGQLQHTAPNVTTYYPDKNSKRAANNVTDLLNMMAIPQIDVNPVTGAVKTNSGQDITIYIDMEPASDDEKEALRAEDVRKVEYFIYPTDPRFNHNKYVINITLRRYNFGGYAKVSGSGNLLVGSGNGQAYAKLAYRRLTFDINVKDKYTDRGHTGTEDTQFFRFPEADGSINEIIRSSVFDDSRFQENRLNTSFRAKYTSEKATISNSLYLSAVNTPHNDYSGQLSFSSPLFANSNYSNTVNSSYIHPRWRGNYFVEFGNGFQAYIAPSVYYQHTKSNRNYRSAETSIITNASEDAVTGEFMAQLNKSFHKYHTVDASVMAVYYHDRTKYSGSTVAVPKFIQYAYGLKFGYTYARDKFYGRVDAGVAGEANEISGVKSTSIIPLADINAQYAFNRRNSISISMFIGLNTPDASEKTPDIIRENELLYKTGNPHLKNNTTSGIDIDYTWLPNNRFSVSAFAGWRRYYNRRVPVFAPDGPDGMMLRSIVNSGDVQDINFGASFRARLFNKSLVINARPQIYLQNTWGLYAAHNTMFLLTLRATYYLKNFYLSAHFSPASKELLTNDLSAVWSKGRSYYMLKAGWSNGKWNLSASAINIFRRDWRATTSSLESQWFSQNTTNFGASSHQFVNFTASYTFSFGKKVKQGDEVEAIEGGNSAIMK